MYISLLLLIISSGVATGRAPLIAYTGQPVELSATGLRSIEANKASKYAAQEILEERLRDFNLPSCVAVSPEILFGSSKVVAGIEYNLHLRLSYQLLRNPSCRQAQNIINNFQDEECQVVVVYQPYKPPKAILALIRHNCHQIIEPFFPEAFE